MGTASEISVVRVQLPAERAGEPAAWVPVAAPAGRRPSPATLAALAALAGVVAMALGGLAVYSAARWDGTAAPPAVVPVPRATPVPAAERRALALLAKPSTQRFVLRGSAGRLVLAVGSGGRAALLIRGLERTHAARPYRAWVVGSGSVTHAAEFTGAERAVLLSVPVARGASVVVAADRAAALRRAAARLFATRP